MISVGFMIDGWFMCKKVTSMKAFNYNGANIRRYCKSHLRNDETLYRIFYYDTEPLEKKGIHPLSRRTIDFSRTPVAQAQNELLQSIKCTPNFALRLGKTVWKNKGWVLDNKKFWDLIAQRISAKDLVEDDIRPLIGQKAVDMKIGLDIAHIATKRLVDKIIVITGDADLVPALKFARREGLQVGLDPLRNNIRPELSEHVDYIRSNIRERMFAKRSTEPGLGKDTCPPGGQQGQNVSDEAPKGRQSNGVK